MISYNTDNVDMPQLDFSAVNAWIKAVADFYDKKIGDIAYVFCDDEKILEVNRQYLSHDYFTDIITFDYCAGKRLNGDIFISLDTVRSNAAEFGVSYLNELCRVIIHGILHLTGQEDKEPEARAEMTRKENLALEMVKDFFTIE